MNRMLKVFTWMVMIFFFSAFFLAAGQADETVKCPVSGKEMKKSEAKITFEYKGQTYYFCCEKAKEAFVKDPEKFLQKKTEECDKDMVCCPVSGKKMKKSEAKVSFEYKGKTYYFCCEKAKEDFSKDPEKYLQKMAEKCKEKMAEGCKDMAMCPVTGEKVKKSDAKLKFEYKGQTYYFCCEKCKDEFTKDPEKYLKTVYCCQKCCEMSDKPGKCPKCGMDMQPKVVAKNCCEKGKPHECGKNKADKKAPEKKPEPQ